MMYKYKYYKYKSKYLNLINKNNNGDIILKYYKTGGIRGITYGIIFYNNGSYKIFDYDKNEHTKTNLTPEQKNAIEYFRKNIKYMPKKYCEFEGIKYDAMEILIESDNISVSLGEGLSEKCVPNEIKIYIKILDDMLNQQLITNNK